MIFKNSNDICCIWTDSINFSSLDHTENWHKFIFKTNRIKVVFLFTNSKQSYIWPRRKYRKEQTLFSIKLDHFRLIELLFIWINIFLNLFLQRCYLFILIALTDYGYNKFHEHGTFTYQHLFFLIKGMKNHKWR